MGNSPSTSKPATPTQRHHVEHAERVDRSSGHDSPRASKKQEPKNLIAAAQHQHQHRSTASSAEASVVSAQGSTIGPRATGTTRPLSILGGPSASNSPSSRSSVAKAKYPEDHDEPSKPVDVPIAQNSQHSTAESSIRSSSQYDTDPLLTNNPASASVTDMSYNLARPPRLPLPIEEEVHTPGSPVIAPQDIGPSIEAIESSLDKEESAGADLTRKSSGLSNATDDDDAEELRVDKTRTVSTKVEWLQGGQKVYVTGTPFQWSRKQRLHPAKGREGVLEATIPVYPGTHHIKFLVDGSMETSMHLPTTVDFGNNLVNYIEVSGEDAHARTMTLGATPPKSATEAQALPSRQPSKTDLEAEEKPPQKKVILPTDRFSGVIPQYLSDFDQPEDSRAYQLSVGALDKLPTPPSLPGFLSKPIMNANALIKDDNSVLNMPNHTVLNHLATSSIKNNVLAVSATTRYRNKYVTTIVYKPTSDDS
ncbi:snf1 kinase complex beta-subunit [Seiridium cupressi]|uniref:Association with the SNF1 complex (ASC) domain-containing protein n=1 Tax=Seiridium unicorne TaxID=138068 RepID=A0ABR2UQC1_9PEZI